MHRAPRQTMSYLRNLMEERGIKPKNKLGQNFLIDLNLIDLLLRTAELSRGDLAVEVGCGTGSLTARLAEEAGAVLAVEIDADFYALACETVDERPNVQIIHTDVLKNKNELHPKVLRTLEEMRRTANCEYLKLVANLPYAVATPVITNFLLTDLPFERMVVTVQLEIAERMIAQPSTKPYGSLAVLVQSLADVELVRQLSPAVFWPRPQVSSAIIRIRPNAEKRAHVGDVIKFRTFLRDLYTHRRKNLRGALSALPSGRVAKDEVDRKLLELGLDGTCRAETLDREQHLRLSAAFG
ncbi:MAG: 16S rRNA (adenine(1518)-N(6)/adenine(1519)-N(6))-dimethyltransferase RsmA [Gemmataceae bacterium]|nr:16S rRNA (adenine(1518)-N(6)/adenine(1519)-N(6))-dimethyltransferase RsmA [Gemmataceae bacterium]